MLTRRQAIRLSGESLAAASLTSFATAAGARPAEASEDADGGAQSAYEANSLDIVYNTMIFRGVGGNCELVRQVDASGKAHYMLCDASYMVSGADLLAWLKGQGATYIEAIIVSHDHSDHCGALAYDDGFLSLMAHDPEFEGVGKIFMKPSDRHNTSEELGLTDEEQLFYNSIIYYAMQQNIPIVGLDRRCAYGSYAHEIADDCAGGDCQLVDTSETSRAASLMQYFDDANTTFKLGEAQVSLLNYETWDADGNALDPESLVEGRTSVINKNNDSMVTRISYDGRTWVLPGDLNNFSYDDWSSDSGHDSGTAREGDEDRLAPTIGVADFYQLAHHGYLGSNTANYMYTLNPSFCMNTRGDDAPYDGESVEEVIANGFDVLEACEYEDDAYVTVRYTKGAPDVLAVVDHNGGAIEKPLRAMATATFDPNGGIVPFNRVRRYTSEEFDALPTAAQEAYDRSLGSDIPNAELEGYTFEGWVSDAGERALPETVLAEDVTYHASWSIKSPDLVDESGSQESAVSDTAEGGASTVAEANATATEGSAAVADESSESASGVIAAEA